MSRIKEWWSYWLDTAKGSKDAFDMVCFIATLISVPAAAIAYLFNEPGVDWEKYTAWALSVIAVFLFLRTIFWLPVRRHQEQEQKYAAAFAIKPLRITARPAYRPFPHSKWWYAIEVEIHNENQSISGVRLRLTKIEPMFEDITGMSGLFHLEGTEFPLIGASDGIMHRNQSCSVHIFNVDLNGGASIMLAAGEEDFKRIRFRPIYNQNHKPIEHVITLAVFATGIIDASVAKFRLVFQSENHEFPVRLEHVK